MSRVENVHALSTPFAAWGRLAANSAAHMTEHLFNGVIVVVLPLITTSLGLSLAQAGALASARTLFAGVGSFPSGFLADLAGRRNLLLGFCISLIGFATFGLSVSSSFAMLMVYMALGGFGGGGFHPQSLAILSAKYREQKAFALGVHDSSANLGEVIGPLALGFLLNFFDWRTSLQIWAIPGLAIGLLYAAFGSEGNLAAPRPRDYRRALWEDVIKNKAVFGLVAVSTLRAMGQTALAVFLPLYLSLHLKLSAGVAAAYMSILFLFGDSVSWVGFPSSRWFRRARRASLGASAGDRFGGDGSGSAGAFGQHRGAHLRREYGSFISSAGFGRIDRRCVWLTRRFACDRFLSIDRRSYYVAAAQAGARDEFLSRAIVELQTS